MNIINVVNKKLIVEKSAKDNSFIKTNIDAWYSEVFANTQYEGDYIFGGSNTKNPPYALADDMSITYSGSTHDQNWQKLLEVASGEELQTNVLGLDIFGDSTKGIFKAVKDLNTIAETEPIARIRQKIAIAIRNNLFLTCAPR